MFVVFLSVVYKINCNHSNILIFWILETLVYSPNNITLYDSRFIVFYKSNSLLSILPKQINIHKFILITVLSKISREFSLYKKLNYNFLYLFQ